MKYKLILKYTVLLLCVTFVLERSVECFVRFFKKSQALQTKMSDGANEIMPHFTFCAAERYNQTAFEECGLRL